MTLIDTAGTPLADPYQYPAADQELTEADHCVVLLSQWDTYQEQFGKTATGVWVTGDQDPADLLPLLNRTRVVVIEFPKSRDGRGFTLARVLRERHRYDGDIRAGRFKQSLKIVSDFDAEFPDARDLSRVFAEFGRIIVHRADNRHAVIRHVANCQGAHGSDAYGDCSDLLHFFNPFNDSFCFSLYTVPTLFSSQLRPLSLSQLLSSL